MIYAQRLPQMFPPMKIAQNVPVRLPLQITRENDKYRLVESLIRPKYTPCEAQKHYNKMKSLLKYTQSGTMENTTAYH